MNFNDAQKEMAFDRRLENVFYQDALKTSETAVNGTADSGGIKIDNTGFYGAGPSQDKTNANVRILTDGSAYFSGTFNLGGTQISVDNISDAYDSLTTIEDAGGGVLHLDNGTYTLTENLVIPGGVLVEGVSRDGVIIDCDGTYKVIITGNNTYTTGTITIADGDTEVVGSGTTFNLGMVGQYILIRNGWYEITAFTDTTHINIADSYNGEDLSGSNYAIADTNFTAGLSKVTITNATAEGLGIEYAMEPTIDDVYIYGCGTGLDFNYVVFPKIFATAVDNGVNLNMFQVHGFKVDYCSFDLSNTSHGVILDECTSSTFFDSAVTGNTGDGINITDCSRIAFISVVMNRNGGQGVELVAGNEDNQFIGVVFNGNVSDGIKLTATSDRNQIAGTTIANNGGYGINIAASTCANNQIIAPAFDNNTSGTINDLGTGTTIIGVGLSDSPKEVLQIDPYFFDGSDASATDPDAVWTGESNATQGSTVTSSRATCTTVGSESTNFIKAEGTNAPTSGANIVQVRARVYRAPQTAGGSITAVTKIYTDGLAENLATLTTSRTQEGWDTYTTLAEPSGGWTWAKIQALEFKHYLSAVNTVTEGLNRVEVEVTSRFLE